MTVYMRTEERIEAFEKLANRLNAIDEGELSLITTKAMADNAWFTLQSVQTALQGIKRYLEPQALRQWTSDYALSPDPVRTIGIVTAGNIPLVGFHDVLSVLISGHNAQIRPSSKDTVLLKYVVNLLIEAEPRMAGRVSFVERLKDFDAVIATGSDNSARYFDYYFGKYPHIIRKNRTSCAVLLGNENTDELRLLGEDVFTYYGLGCRNVSKVFVPQTFDMQQLFGTWTSYAHVLDHHKYHNNYDYQKSIRLVNRTPFLDTGFVLAEESSSLVSPISVLYYERYIDDGDLAVKLMRDKNKIQCIVGKGTPGWVAFGSAQSPMVWDYADQVDTLAFLQNL